VDAHLSSDGCWFAGIILRRADGSVVGAATRWHQTTNKVVLGKALALNDALDLLESLRISWVILESDCQSLVNAIRWKREIRKQWGSVVKRCIEFLKVNPQSDIKWVGRSGNRVAHELAKWAEKEPNIEWTTSLPCCIIPYIQKDMGPVNLS
jgi:ribonuclease HI